MLIGKVNNVYDSAVKGQLEVLYLEPSWVLPCVLLPLAYFNVYLFAVLNCEYDSFQ